MDINNKADASITKMEAWRQPAEKEGVVFWNEWEAACRMPVVVVCSLCTATPGCYAHFHRTSLYRFFHEGKVMLGRRPGGIILRIRAGRHAVQLLYGCVLTVVLTYFIPGTIRLVPRHCLLPALFYYWKKEGCLQRWITWLRDILILVLPITCKVSGCLYSITTALQKRTRTHGLR